MEPLDQSYVDQLDQIADQIQNSDALVAYLENEEEEEFMELRNTFEPAISALHREVAEKYPLQIISFEKHMLQDKFEGLFLPKILGFSVLRGELNNEYKYVQPQEHFKNILLAICNSSNFDYLKMRIGQSVQTGLMFSSDIWTTNLINGFTNKRVKSFLQSLKSSTLRDPVRRASHLQRYKRQFINEVYQSAPFPTSIGELSIGSKRLHDFIVFRVKGQFDNSSLEPAITAFLSDDKLTNEQSHFEITTLFAHFFELNKKNSDRIKALFKHYRTSFEDFDEVFFRNLLELYERGLQFNEWTDRRMLDIVDPENENDVTKFHALMLNVHQLGFSNDESIGAIREFYNSHEGLSTVNKVLRTAVLHFVNRFLGNIDELNYGDFFELVKIYAPYMQTFSNQRFNQGLKEASLRYVKKLIKHYTDKRGKDYQDIKKFVMASFVDHGFYTEKQVAEIFKTRRKKKVTA